MFGFGKKEVKSPDERLADLQRKKDWAGVSRTYYELGVTAMDVGDLHKAHLWLHRADTIYSADGNIYDKVGEKLMDDCSDRIGRLEYEDGLAGQNIPGVVDLIVFEKYRRKKIATMLLDAAENIAKQHCNKIYLDVCLNNDYGPAQRFYIKRGYIPDGKGVYYKEKVCETDAVCRNDDELTLWLAKEL